MYFRTRTIADVVAPPLLCSKIRRKCLKVRFWFLHVWCVLKCGIVLGLEVVWGLVCKIAPLDNIKSPVLKMIRHYILPVNEYCLASRHTHISCTVLSVQLHVKWAQIKTHFSSMPQRITVFTPEECPYFSVILHCSWTLLHACRHI